MYSLRPIIRQIAVSTISGLMGLALLAGPARLGAQTDTIIAEGFGMTRDAALSEAKRSAVEQGVGVILTSETSVKNFQVERDKILSKANGFVKTYKEISSSQGPDGLWTIRISAEITAILDELVKDQLALDLLLSWVRHPRFMIVMEESNGDETGSTVAETEIGRIMGSKGFDIVSAAQTDALKSRNVNLAEIQGDPLAAAGMAAEFGAEYIIMGNATAKAVSHPMLGARLSGQANISAKVVRADNAQIIAQETFHGKSTHIDGTTAGVNALKQAAGKLADYLLAETVRRWSLEQSNARVLTLKISGLTYQTRRQVLDFLNGGIEGIRSIDQRSFAAGVVTLAVEFTGSNEDLGMVLDGHDLGAFVLYIQGESSNGFDLVAQSK